MSNLVRYLHGRRIHVNDLVFDAAMGQGKVVSMTADPAGIVVRFSAGRQASYTDNGHTPRFQQATLFWTNPIIPLPADLTAAQRSIVAATAQTLATNLVGKSA